MTKDVSVVTGVGRAEGLGFEVCRQLGQRGGIVALTARDGEKAQALAKRLQAEGLDVRPYGVDIAQDASVETLVSRLTAELGHVDALINNAGASYDFGVQTLDATLEQVQGALEVNLFGAWRLSRALLPLLRRARRAPGACVVNVSSDGGSFSAARGLAAGKTLSAYGVSKAALNAFTVKWAVALQPEGIRVNAVCPGFIASHAGTAERGARPVAEGARGVVWAASLPPDGPTGGFFRDGEPLGW